MEHFIDNILGKMTGVAKPQKKFLVTLFLTILLMRGKANFRNMSRYSDLSEKTYSRQYRKPFDFADFNTLFLIKPRPFLFKINITRSNQGRFYSKSGVFNHRNGLNSTFPNK